MEKVGYRSDEAYGSNVSKIEDVLDFEINELGNEDILDYIKDNYNIHIDYSKTSKNNITDIVNQLRKKVGKNITRCLWLCDNIEDVVNNYLDLDKIEYYNEQDALTRYISQYKISDIVLSDLSEDGKLYAYTENEWKNRFI